MAIDPPKWSERDPYIAAGHWRFGLVFEIATQIIERFPLSAGQYLGGIRSSIAIRNFRKNEISFVISFAYGEAKPLARLLLL